MRVPRSGLIGLVAALCVVAGISTTAQTYVPIRVNASAYPAISAKIYVLDATGLPQSIGPNEVTATENGVAVNPTTSCEPSSGGRSLSLLVSMDVSASTSLGSPSNLDFMRNGALAVSQLLTSTSDEIGFQTIDAQANLMYGLSTDKVTYTSVVNSVRSSGGLRISNGLLDQPMGALRHLQNARNGRALLLFTDGSSTFDLKSALGSARSFGIRVYVICIRSKATAELKALADSSGGAWTENVSTNAAAQAFARGYVADAKQLPACTLVWTATEICSPARSIVMTRATVLRSSSYAVPDSNITVLEASTTGVEFGEPPAGMSATSSLQLTARNGDVLINSFSISNPLFTVEATQFPVTILKGQSITVTLRFNAVSTDGAFAQLTIGSPNCNIPTISLHGGSPFRGDVLKLVQPNGGGDYLAGADTTITWTNVLPQDVVRLELSTDGGSSWRPITETANGLSYSWRPGPEVADKARIRVSRTFINADKIAVLRGQNQPVYSITFTDDGQRVITGGHDGTVRLWNPFNGTEERLVGVHNDWVWDVAVMPGTTLVASASFDQSVRIWDYTTGVRVATIPVEGRSRAVAFTPDGKKLFAGTDRSIVEISTTDWSISTTKIVDQGPVFDIDVSSNGKHMAIAEGTKATVRDPSSLEVTATCAVGGRTGLIYAVGINSDGTRVVSGGTDFIITTFNGTTGAQLATTLPATGSILGLTFSPNGSTILSAGADATAKIFDAASLSLQSSLAGHSGIVYGSCYSPNAKRVGTASTDFTGRVWLIDAIGTNEDASDLNFKIGGADGVANNINMGDVELGAGQDKIAPAVTTSGTSPLVILGASIVSGDVSDFAILSTSLQSPISLSSPLLLDVSFTPTVLGPRSADVIVSTGTGFTRVRLSGNGVNPLLTGPTLIDFGRHIANQSIVDTTVTLRMPSTATSPVVVNVTRLNGPQSNQITIVSGGGSFTLNPGQARSIALRFEPIDFGRFAGELILETQVGNPVRVKLYGEGTGDGRASAASSILFPTNVCTSGSPPQTVELRNFGNAQLQVFSAGIEGASADEFTVTTAASFPITVEPGGVVPFAVTFIPNRTGAKDAKVVFSSSAVNAINGRTVTQISARKDSVGFELSRPDVNFGNIGEGEQAIERLLLLNSGTVALRWNRTSIVAGNFRIENISPEITQTGEYSDLTVRFVGGTAGSIYNESYTFVDSICGTRQTLRMTASVKSVIGATIRIGAARAKIGSEVSVPITVTNKSNLDRTQVPQVEAILVVNGTILTPTAGTPMGTFRADGMREFIVPIPLQQTDSVATTLRFMTSWGNDTTSIIHIDSIVVADTLVFKTQDGKVDLSDICREGGARLIDLTQQAASVRLAPLPATGSTTAVISTVEAGRTKLELIDISGRLISTLVDRVMQGGSWFVPIDFSTTPNGSYILVLTTPTQRIVERIEVVR